jgi:hypothetical protein
MVNRLLLGAAAGAAATVPQSAAIWGLRRAGVYQRREPPRRVAEAITARTVAPSAEREGLPGAVMWLQHFGFGAAGGALYGAATRVVPAGPLTGLAAGLTIWATSYGGWIPALGILPPPQDDDRGRQIALVIAHIAYGLTLGWLVQRFQRR